MQTNFIPLVITPLPNRSESLMGFLLRTSEANGYKRLSYILRYAGLSETEFRSIRPPLQKVARLFGQEAAYLSNYYPDQAKDIKKNEWKINGHTISSQYVNFKSANLCPECVLKNGYIHNIWELQFIKICTIHKRELIDACPSCKKPIIWRRQGLLTCICGQDLSETRGQTVSDSGLLSMSALIEWKIANHQYDDSDLVQAGYPLTQLKKVSLSTLLGIVERLQKRRKRKTNFPQPYGRDSKLNVLKVASTMFEQWPHGFYNLLESFSPENRHVASRNLQAQYRHLYYSLFKSSLPKKEVKFIQEALVTFANDRLGQDVYIDVRLAKQAETSRRYVGIYGLAQHLNVQLPTIINYVKKGLLKPEVGENMGQTWNVFDLETLPFKPKDGNYLVERKAAKFLGISVRFLKELTKQGLYKKSRLGWGGIKGYSELDLLEFEKGVIEKAPTILKNISDTQIKLAEIFRKKHHQEISIKIIDDILNNNLVPAGRIGDKLGDIILTKMAV